MEPLRKTDWHVVVPVKGGRAGKSRLRFSLDDEALVAAIIHDTLEVVAAVVTPCRVVVVTGDDQEAEYADGAGFSVVSDPGTGLNDACRAGLMFLRDRGAPPAAVLLGDHPALMPEELLAALGAGAHLETFFVPDAEGSGTALVGTTGAGVPDLAFGPNSADQHSALGHVRLDLDLPGLRHDVDDEDSLRQAAARLTLGPRTREALGR